MLICFSKLLLCKISIKLLYEVSFPPILTLLESWCYQPTKIAFLHGKQLFVVSSKKTQNLSSLCVITNDKNIFNENLHKSQMDESRYSAYADTCVDTSCNFTILDTTLQSMINAKLHIILYSMADLNAQ